MIPAAIMIALWVGWFLAQNIGSVDSRFAYRHPLVTSVIGIFVGISLPFVILQYAYRVAMFHLQEFNERKNK